MDHLDGRYQEDFRRSQVPAFGSWDVDAVIPFTQCFESARQPGLRRVYVAPDLYQNDVVTPAVILLPRPIPTPTPIPRQQTKAQGQAHAKIKDWGYYDDDDYNYNYSDDIDVIKEPASPPPPPRRQIAKAVDQDLYKIPSEFVCPTPTPTPKRKGGLGFFSSCLMPVCV